MPPSGAAFRLNYPVYWIAVLLPLLLPKISTVFGAEGPTRVFNIPAGDAADTLKLFAVQAEREIMFPAEPVAGVRTSPVEGTYTPRDALERMVGKTGFVIVEDRKTGALMVIRPEATVARVTSPDSKPTASAEHPNTKMKSKNPIAILGSLLALALAPAPTARAADAGSAATGIVAGRVVSDVSSAALPNVRVTVEGSNLETVTDKDGEYVLANVPAGSARLRVTYIGMADQTEAVTVEAGQRTRKDFSLSRGAADKELVKMEAFTVIADREMSAQTLALNEQRQAANVKTVVAYDEYPTGYDSSLAYFLRFVPGVSNTSVRGTPADMGSVTIDGAEVAGTLASQTRAAPLNFVPVNNVSRVEVTKVPTPDMPAGLGGVINIITKSGFERTKPLFTYNIYTAYLTPLGTNLKKEVGLMPGLTTRHVLPSLDFTYIRPINKSLAITLAASQLQNYNYNSGTISTWDLVKLNLQQVNNTYSPSRVDVRNGRLGVDWKIGAKDIVNASIQYRDRKSAQLEEGLLVAFGSGYTAGQTFTHGGPAANGSVSQTLSDLQVDGKSRQMAARYEHKGDIWKINASTSDSQAVTKYHNTDRGYFYNPSLNRTGLIINGDGIGSGGDTIERTRPQTVTATDSAGNKIDVRDGSNLAINSAASLYNDFRVYKSELKADIARDWATAVPVRLKVGGAILPYKSTGDNTGQTWTFRPGATVADRLVGNYGLINREHSAVGPVFAGQRVQWVDPVKLYDLSKAHPEYFVLDEAASWRTHVNTSKKLKETISAGYVRGDVKFFNNRLWLVGGVRYEQTDDEGWGPLVDPTNQYRKDASGKVLRDAANAPILITTDALQRTKLQYTERGSHTERSYSGYYPSLNASYTITENLVARFGYAQTIGRPPISQIAPSVTVPDATSTSNIISVTNTGLKPWSATSYDLSLESYLFKGGVGSVSVFQKDIKDFFVTTTIPATPALLDLYGVEGGDANRIYDIATTTNGGASQLRGIEISYKQSLFFLPDWARGFQVFGNWTQRTVTGTNVGDFSGFFPSNLSWGINFTRPRLAIKFSSTYRAELRGNLIAASATIPVNTYDWSRASLSYQGSIEYRITPRIGIYLTMQDFNTKYNLLGLRRHNPDTPDWAADRQTLSILKKAVVGVRGDF